MRRAQVTTENARRMYGDLLDRVIADREEETSKPEAVEATQGESTEEASLPHHKAPRHQQPHVGPRSSAGSRPQPEAEDDRPRVKATFYLYPEDIVTIDRIQMQEFLDLGKKPQRSEIVSRALRLLGSRELSGAS